MDERFKIEQGCYGNRATILGALDQKAINLLTEINIHELTLNTGLGWHGKDIDFLIHFPDLVSFEIIDHHIKSIEPIHVLKKLKRLQASTYCNTPIDFAAFPNLEDASLEWHPKRDSIFSCIGLKKLFINRYNHKNTDKFSSLTNLEHLILLGAAIDNLDGLSGLLNLSILRLGRLRNLVSLTGIAKLINLVELEIGTCRKIRNIKFVEHLINLQRFIFSNCGDISSLAPLKHLPHLELVSFAESTNIIDGDLTPLIQRSKVPKTLFQNRKHYSHTREYIQALVRPI